MYFLWYAVWGAPQRLKPDLHDWDVVPFPVVRWARVVVVDANSRFLTGLAPGSE
jgi:hypothetical protein